MKGELEMVLKRGGPGTGQKGMKTGNRRRRRTLGKRCAQMKLKASKQVTVRQSGT